MTMIEQMARASHEFFRPIYGLPPFDELPPDAKSTMFQHAAAILAGMREPPASLKRFDAPGGDVVIWDATCHYCGGAKFIWQAMIDKAIEEKPA